jgi:hypothetical protein
MEVSGQLHASIPREELPEPIVYGDVPELVWVRWRKEESIPLPGIEPWSTIL